MRSGSRSGSASPSGTTGSPRKVPCGDYFGVRDQALLAHATQIDPDGMWFAIPREIQQKVWPTEDYELVSSTVESTLPEDDLFAGIPTPAP